MHLKREIIDPGICTLCGACVDLSFGGAGSKEGYTTLLARTGLGLELFRKMQIYMIKKRFEKGKGL